MGLVFYPSLEEANKGTLIQRVEVLLRSAESYKSAVLDPNKTEGQERPNVPRDLSISYNWSEMTSVLRLIRSLPEHHPEEKTEKAKYLAALADVYHVLTNARMPKLEAVKLALLSEAYQLDRTIAKS